MWIAQICGGRNEMVLQTQQAEVYLNEALKAVLTSLVAMCAQTCVVVQRDLGNTFRPTSTELDLEVKRTMVDVQEALERDNTDVYRDFVRLS